MDRYQIITARDKPIAYKFKSSTNAATVYSYMVKCIEDQVLLEASNIPDHTLEEASVRISRDYEIPVITTSKRTTLMRIIHGYEKIYAFEAVPSKCRNVLCLWDVNPREDWKPLLRIIKNPIDND